MGALGFPTYRYKLICFVIAGAGAGLAGALMANQTEFVSPSLLHWTVSGNIRDGVPPPKKIEDSARPSSPTFTCLGL